MTLFKDESAAFRRGFFRTLTVQLRGELLEPRLCPFSRTQATRPGAKRRPSAPSDRRRPSSTPRPVADRIARFGFSPRSSRTSQLTARLAAPTQRSDIWTIVVAANQVQAVDVDEAANGRLLPWKLAMWGSHFD